MSKRFTLCAIALCSTVPLAGFVSPPASAAPRPTDAPAETLVKTVLAKVDGDNISDTVQLFDLGVHRYRMRVTTNTGASSAVEFTSFVTENGVRSPWGGAGALDGVVGKELVVTLWPSDSSTEPVSWGVYTWRHGTLVAEGAPKAPKGTGGAYARWVTDDGSAAVFGHRVYTAHKHTYMDVSRLAESNNGKWWTGKIIRSVWTSGAWKRVATQSVKLGFTKADKYLGLTGVDLVLGNVRSDIDGDGRNDRVDFFRYADYQHGHYVPRNGVKVMTATGKTKTRKFRGAFDTIFGAASIDGVPGAEIALQQSEEDLRWMVFTWRSGKLVTEPAPALCDQAKPSWTGCGNEGAQSVTFTVEAGVPTATAAYSYGEEVEPVYTLWRSIWVDNRWTLSSRTTRVWQQGDGVLLQGLYANWVAP